MYNFLFLSLERKLSTDIMHLVLFSSFWAFARDSLFLWVFCSSLELLVMDEWVTVHNGDSVLGLAHKMKAQSQISIRKGVKDFPFWLSGNKPD